LVFPGDGGNGDPEIFEVWATLVVAAEKLCAFEPRLSETSSLDDQVKVRRGSQLIALGKDLIFHMTRARVPMPKSTREYVERLQMYREHLAQMGRPQLRRARSSR